MSHKSQVQLTHIHNLIRNAQHPLIQNLNQLCKVLFGKKRCTWLVFQRLMHWLNYSKRSDGSIYKSSKELAEEIGCCEKTIDRAIPALIEVGFDVEVKKANGAPTRHFRLNMDRLLTLLADIFLMTVAELRNHMEIPQYTQDTAVSDISTSFTPALSPDTIAHNVRNDLKNLSESLTRTTTQKNMQLRQHGFSSPLEYAEAMLWCKEIDTTPETIISWTKTFGFETVQATIMEARSHKERGRIYKSMYGWVYAALKSKHQRQSGRF